eukprot:jgi/Ulvmu1/6717/UM030_0050.1
MVDPATASSGVGSIRAQEGLFSAKPHDVRAADNSSSLAGGRLTVSRSSGVARPFWGRPCCEGMKLMLGFPPAVGSSLHSAVSRCARQLTAGFRWPLAARAAGCVCNDGHDVAVWW